MSMLQHYQSWLEKKPGDRLAMYGVALELKKAGQTDAAREAFEALLAVHPHSGAGWFQYGALFEEAGEEELAVATWQRGLEALADSTDAEAKRSMSEIRTALAALE
ncbi:MAG: tetratricopeptide repeat protein [Myxococcota bacterium]